MFGFIMLISETLINNRTLTLLHPISDELSFEVEKNYIFDLSYLAALDVCGDKAAEFLQGQLSCDINEVNTDTMRRGAMCNLQGRILALIDIIDWCGLHLILPYDLLKTTQTSLAKTAMFSRVTLQPNSSFNIFGFYLQNSTDRIPFDAILPKNINDVVVTPEYACYQCTDKLYIFLVNSSFKDELISAYKLTQQRGSLAWHWLQMRHGLIEIYPNSQSIFLPHRLLLHKTSVLSFNKGCYKGQEIIARTQYRAKLKHDMKQFIIKTTEQLYSGQAIFDSTGKVNIGELIDYCPIAHETYLIAISSVFEHDTKLFFDGHKSELDAV